MQQNHLISLKRWVQIQKCVLKQYSHSQLRKYWGLQNVLKCLFTFCTISWSVIFYLNEAVPPKISKINTANKTQHIHFKTEILKALSFILFSNLPLFFLVFSLLHIGLWTHPLVCHPHIHSTYWNYEYMTMCMYVLYVTLLQVDYIRFFFSRKLLVKCSHFMKV